MKPRISMRDALADPDLFGNVLGGDSWYGWRVLLIASAGEELTNEERIEFKRLTGRDREPGRMCREFIVIAGRRGGKTLALAVFDCWIAALCDHHDVLAPGETGVALLISRDQRAAKIALGYINGILSDSPILCSLIANRTQDTTTLTNAISIEVRPCNLVSARGATFVSIIADEVAHWFTATDSANADVEVLAGARPGLMTTHGPVLMASSAYSQHGVLYDSVKHYYGANGPDDIIVAYGTSRDFNPSLSQEEIDRELEKDPTRNRAEYLSEWRNDLEGFIARQIVEDNVGDYYELPPQQGIDYRCFVDPASGVPEGDSYVIVIGHKLDDRVVVDCVREIRPPFDVFALITDILVPLCKSYRIYTVYGDNYAGEFSKEPIRKAGIGYELASKHKSELYLDPFLPMLNARRLTLPRHDRAINEICALERSVQRSGRDSISHPPRAHDDCANAIAGCVDLCCSKRFRWEVFSDSYKDPPPVQQASTRLPTQPAPPVVKRVHPRNWHEAMPRSNEKIPGVDGNFAGYLMALARKGELP